MGSLLIREAASYIEVSFLFFTLRYEMKEIALISIIYGTGAKHEE
tara:strand:+ start:14993 stop:15127 length:135 start_codon:yes stop_codon:yes gene_type:complete